MSNNAGKNELNGNLTGSCPDLSDEQLKLWDDILFGAIQNEREVIKLILLNLWGGFRRWTIKPKFWQETADEQPIQLRLCHRNRHRPTAAAQKEHSPTHLCRHPVSLIFVRSAPQLAMEIAASMSPVRMNSVFSLRALRPCWNGTKRRGWWPMLRF